MSDKSLPKEDVEAIRSVFSAVARYLQAGDLPSWASEFAEDAVLMPPNGPSVTGRAAIQAFGEAMPEIREISFFDVEIEGQGDRAVGWSGISQTLVLEDGTVIKDTGKQLVVMRKETDGKWVPTKVMFNSDLPLG